MLERGCRDSEDIVMGWAKRLGLVVNIANAEWSSEEAVMPDCMLAGFKC